MLKTIDFCQWVWYIRIKEKEMTKIRKQRTKRFGRFQWVSSSQNSRLSE